LGGHPIGRIVGGEAVHFDWRRLLAEYTAQFRDPTKEKQQ
jgi:hypothetical protein